MPNLPPEIQEILKRAENRHCADCQARDPKWASVSIGIIICETCAGIHRKLGTHLSTVKSASLDKWKPEWVVTVKAIGNARAGAFYEHNVPQDERYVGSSTVSQGDKLDTQEGRKLERWIRDKYELLKYAPQGAEEPRKLLERGEPLDDGRSPGGAEKREKKSKHRSHRKAEEGAGAGGFSEAFAALGEWAAESPDAEGRAASEGKEIKHKKSKKKEKRESSRQRHASSLGQLQEEGGFGGGAVADAAGAGGDLFGMPGNEASPYGATSPSGGCGGDGWGYGAAPGPPGGAPTAPMHADPAAAQQAAVAAAAAGERRRALLSVARLFQAPESMGLVPGVGAALLPLHGFDLQAAEFHPTALRRPRDLQEPYTANKPRLDSEATEFFPVVRPRADSEVSGRFGGTDANASSRARGDSEASGFFVGPEPHGSGRLRADSEVSLLQDELKKIRHEMRSMREDYRGIKEETISALRSQDGTRSRLASAITQDDAEDWWARAPGPASPQPPAPHPPPVPAQWATPNGALSTSGAAAELGLMASGGGQQAVLPFSPDVGRLPPADVSGQGPDTAWMAGESPGAPASGRYQPQATGGTDVGLGEAAQQPVGSFGYVDREAFARYAHYFRQLDENQDNLVEGRDVRRLFDQSTLDPSELKLIWAVCDTSRAGRLTLEEFACAMHIVSCRCQGVELPLQLPPELSNAVRHLAAEYRATAPPPQSWSQAPEAAGGAEGDGAGQSTPWEPSPEDLERYQSTYAAIDVEGVGSIGPMEAKELLEKTGLPTEELSQIWQMSDVDLDSRLSPGELVCAMHLATRRMQGFPLPAALPPELAAFAPAAPGAGALDEASPLPPANGAALGPGPLDPGEEGGWQGSVAEEELAEIWHLSDADGDGRLAYNDFVYAALLLASRRRGLELPADIGRKEAFDILEQSNLSSAELSRIWRMADADGDGQLTFGDFALAVHLASRRLRGLELPRSPLADAEAAQVPLEPAAPPPPPASASSSGPGLMGEPGSPWAITPERVRRYRALFNGLPRQEPDVLRQDEVRGTLERSGLPREDLARIWTLADADADGALTFGEFACALHLVAGRRQGLELPPALPPELQQLADLAEAMGGAGAGHSAASSGLPWAVLPDQLERYRDFFESLERNSAGNVGPQEAVDFMSRSQLPHDELMHTLQLSDMDGDGQLTFAEFACAMHLVTLRCQGLELPPEVPAELVASLPGSWAVSDEQLRRYHGLFCQAAGNASVDALGPDEAWEVLERSALPRDELGRILQLADADGDGRLTPGEFACAMHLTARCRQGAAVPAELPSELLNVEARMAAVS